MKKVLAIGGIAALIAILGVAALGAVALAQDGDDGPFNFRERFNEVVAELLGIPVSDYEEALGNAQEQVLGEAVDEGFLTEEQKAQIQERFENGEGPGMIGPRGMFPGEGFPKGEFPEGGFHGRGMRGMPFGWKGTEDGGPLSAAAEALGMSVDDLLAEVQAGKSVAELAEEKGVDLETIADAYLAPMKESLTAAVEAGKLTQEQADQKLDAMKERILGMLDQTWPEGDFHHFPGGGRHGSPGQFEDLPDQNDA